jgi:hypothetical protein
MFFAFPYSLVLVVQALCVLHVIKSRRDSKWIWLIVFLSIIGCAVYFVMEILPGLRSASLPDLDIPLFQKLKIKAAEKQLARCDSMDNRVELAELYATYGREQDALALIKDHMQGVHRDSPYVLFTYGLILFKNREYAKAWDTIAKLEAVSDHVRRRERAVLKGRILAEQGEDERAVAQLKDACRGFNGEEARYRYAAQLLKLQRPAEARAVADEGIAYFRDSEALYRRQERPWYRGLKQLRSQAQKQLRAVAVTPAA